MTSLKTGPMDALHRTLILRAATLWQITRTDTATYHFTDHNLAISYGGQTYTPVEGFERSAHRKEAGIQSQNTGFQGVLSSSEIKEEDLALGKFRDAKIDEYIIDWRYPWAGYYEYNVFWITHTWTEGMENHAKPTENWQGMWRAETGGLGHLLQRKVGRNFVRKCPYVFGDPDTCKYPLTYSPFTRTVQAPVYGPYDNYREFETTGGMGYWAYPGHWRLTKIHWLTGDNADEYSVIAWNGGSVAYDYIKLAEPLPNEISAGDTFEHPTVVCSRTIKSDLALSMAGCKQLGNILNFGGQEYLPGQDDMMKMPDSKV